MGDGVVVSDENGRFILHNPAAERIAGVGGPDLPPEEWSRHYGAFLPDAVTPHPSDQLPLLRAMRGESVDDAAMFIRNKAQPAGAYLSVTARPLRDQEGRLRGGVLVFRDVTEQKRAADELAESEHRFREMLENVRLASVMMNERGSIIFCNDFFLRLTGWRREEVIGRDWFDSFLPSDEAERMRPEFGRWMSHGSPPGHDEHPIVTREHGQRLIAWSHTPLRDRGGQIIGLTCLGEDITERRRLQEEALKRGRLESLGVLAGGIAHDFNNILTAVLGNILLVKSGGNLDATTRHRLEESEQACLRARHLTQQILTFSRGGEPIKRVVVLEDLIRAAAASVLQGARARCDFKFAAGLWPVEADPGQLQQAVANIIANARQAMPTGGVIQIAAENLSPSAGPDAATDRASVPQVRITVRDEGPGVSAENLPKIFDPYFTTRREGGGLGLSIAYSVVTRHGGHISGSSPPGSGALITILLPAAGGASAAEPPVAEAPAAKTPAAEPAVAPEQARILVMDDEQVIREVTGGMLEHLGYRPSFAPDGAAAIAMFHRARDEGRPFAAVIFDLTVPGGIGGAEAIRALRALDPSVRAIVASGYSHDPVMADHRAHGFDALLSKPFGIEDLKEALRGLPRSPR